jgi:ribonuclease E
VLESSTDKCPHCGGTGHVRSVASVALQVLRMIEETLLRGGTHNLIVRTRSDIAIYVLNHKRAHLRDLEERFHIAITINADAAMGGQTPFLIERGEQVHSVEQARAIAAAQPAPPAVIEPEDEEPFVAEEEEIEAEAEATEGVAETEAEDTEDEAEELGEAADAEGRGEAREGGEGGEGGDGGRRRRRRRRRGRRGEGREPREGGPFNHETAPEHAVAPYDGDEGQPLEAGEAAEHDEGRDEGGEAREHAAHGNGNGEAERRRRRRGRRGGRRNRRGREGEERFASDMPQDEAGDQGGAAVEPELADAVADVGAPPATTYEHAEAVALPYEPTEPRETEHARAAEPTSAPAPAPEAPPAPEPPRRRSTIREPVPFITDEGPASYVAPSAPPPEPPSPPTDLPPPAAQEQPQDDAGKPRRTGWWSKRVLGG